MFFYVRNYQVFFALKPLLFSENKLLSGHDISEGGFITTILEMGIGGIRGVNIDLHTTENITPIEALFNEELGIIIEVNERDVNYVLKEYERSSVNATKIGFTGKYGMNSQVFIKVNGEGVLDKKLIDVYRMWEETSYQLECLQANSACAKQEWLGNMNLYARFS